MKRVKHWILFFFVAGLFLFFSLPASAEGETLPLRLSPASGRLVDGRENARATVTELTVSADAPICGLYLVYFDTPTSFVLRTDSASCAVKASYLRQFIDVDDYFAGGSATLTLTFERPAELLEIYGFAGEIPSWVQVWREPCERADLCLMTSHADDEQLFFAGVLPYYAGAKGYEVQVVYFTDHKNEPLRRHELLRGLWTVGVTHYPVISPFPDLYSESEAAAQQQFAARGFTREAVVGFQVEMLRRFRPLVVVGHDPNGEYGHGQHRLNSSTLQEAVRISGDPSQYPESAEAYGVWEVPKTYLHLYPENGITMDWDVPLEAFGGKTAFQMTQAGFLCHDSQQYTWFRRWLNGNAGEITKASQITTHSPCRYGLYLSRVGEDVLKNDFFENLETWRERDEKIALARFDALTAEIREREEAERLRLEEDRRLEEERIAEENRRLEEERKEKETRQKNALYLSLSVFALLCLFFAVTRFGAAKKKKRRKRA